jgi:glutamyl-tRNA reductase
LVRLEGPDEPWALVAQAGEVPVDRRTELAADLRESGRRRRRALLATCHRVELYGIGEPAGRPDMRLLRGEAAVRRLFRVAAGLESAVVGEDEVLHQVRVALAGALAGGLDVRLARLFESAIAAGRSARSTPAGPGPTLAERAVAWLEDRVPLSGRLVLVAGTGPMGAALARAAEAAGASIAVASRTPGRAPLDLVEAAELAPRCAAVAAALGGEWAELARHTDGARPLPPVADLSSPPAVPPSVRQRLADGFLGIDGLWERGRGERGWVERAEAVVEDSVGEYLGWLHGRGSVDALRALKERGEARRSARVERLLRRLPDLAPRERELVESMSRQLVTDLLHEPISELRADPDGSRREAALRLFRL